MIDRLKYLFSIKDSAGRLEFFLALVGWLGFIYIIALSTPIILDLMISAPESSTVEDAALSYDANPSLSEINELHATAKSAIMSSKILRLTYVVAIFSISSFALRRLRDISKPLWLWAPVFFVYFIFVGLLGLAYPGGIDLFAQAVGNDILGIINNFLDDLIYVLIAVQIYTCLLIVVLTLWPGEQYRLRKQEA